MSVLVVLGGLTFGLLYSAYEAATNPGYSLIDGYWVGRLPWMSIVEGMVVGGATSSMLTSGATVLAFGGSARRLATVPLLVAGGLWWFLAWGNAGVSHALCDACSPIPFDPWAYAYSAPLLAFQLLVAPGLILAALALIPRIAIATPDSGADYNSPS